MAPTLMKAVVKTGLGKAEVKSIKVPQPGSGQVLVKVFAAAQNPADCSLASYFPFPNPKTYAMFLHSCRDEAEDGWVGCRGLRT